MREDRVYYFIEQGNEALFTVDFTTHAMLFCYMIHSITWSETNWILAKRNDSIKARWYDDESESTRVDGFYERRVGDRTQIPHYCVLKFTAILEDSICTIVFISLLHRSGRAESRVLSTCCMHYCFTFKSITLFLLLHGDIYNKVKWRICGNDTVEYICRVC